MATADISQEFKTLLGRALINWEISDDRLFAYLMNNDFVFDASAHTRMDAAAITAARYAGSAGISVELGYRGGAGAGRAVTDGVFLVGGEDLVWTAPTDSSGASKIVLFGWLLDAATDEEDYGNIVPITQHALEVLPQGGTLTLNVPNGVLNLNQAA